MSEDETFAALEEAVANAPADVSLRTHLASAYAAASRADDAWRHAMVGLQLNAAHPGLAELVAQLSRSRATTPPPPPPAPPGPAASPPMASSPSEESAGVDVEWDEPTLTLADVAGLEEVKRRLELAVLAPLRNPKLAAAFHRKGSGGMLLWGPPGCGKTFLAKALAGEMHVSFSAVGIDEILDMWLGASERNLASVFDAARQARPSVLFLDELDALGMRRSRLHHTSQRGVVNTLLAELDGAESDNDGVFVIGATNQPWDIDPALRRPGRLDRTIFVPPPDREARAAILAERLARQPLGNVDVRSIVNATRGFSGADVAHLADTAADLAFSDSLAAGEVAPIEQQHLVAAARQLRPSIGDWVASAESAALASNDEATYGTFLEWLRTGGT